MPPKGFVNMGHCFPREGQGYTTPEFLLLGNHVQKTLPRASGRRPLSMGFWGISPGGFCPVFEFNLAKGFLRVTLICNRYWSLM